MKKTYIKILFPIYVFLLTLFFVTSIKADEEQTEKILAISGGQFTSHNEKEKTLIWADNVASRMGEHTDWEKSSFLTARFENHYIIHETTFRYGWGIELLKFSNNYTTSSVSQLSSADRASGRRLPFRQQTDKIFSDIIGLSLIGFITYVPKGVIRPYIGVGLGCILSNVKDSKTYQSESQLIVTESDSGRGYDGVFSIFAGVKFLVTDNLFLTAEFQERTLTSKVDLFGSGYLDASYYVTGIALTAGIRF